MLSRRHILQGLTTSALLPFTDSFAQLPQQPAAPTLIAVNKINDRFALVHPASVRLGGLLGERMRKNELNRLLVKDEGELLRGFQQRPGAQAWAGEHVGKWLHAATLAWAHTSNPELRAKLDRVVNALLVTQQPDGYLGTYANGAHWAMGKDEKWDVWVHKYNLIGLLTYAQYTGTQAALDACKRIGDLLIANFGATGPLDINERSTHVGMASGSVIEPLVLLWRASNDQRYLDFARLIADKWEAPNGPKLISALSTGIAIQSVANGKAYEMLSCLNGLCELYRATGEVRFLNPALNAWINIVTYQLLPTGSGSSKEHWTPPKQYLTSEKDNVGETCVTVTWMQFNQQLLRLTGQPKYADELEKTYFNHLAAAQRPDGAEWCYFTAHDGKKPYQREQNCCTSNGPRGWALLPTFAYQVADEGIIINFITPGSATLKLNNGKLVTIKQETNYPVDGRVRISVTVPEPMKFSLRLRVPAWSQLNGLKVKTGEYWLLRQTWSKTQILTFDFALPVRLLNGEGQNAGRVALARGPLVLAVDEQFNQTISPLNAIALASAKLSLRTLDETRDADGLPVYEIDGVMVREGRARRAGERIPVRLSPFASAGATGKEYAVWLGAPLVTAPSD